jgi:hypothetical protein
VTEGGNRQREEGGAAGWLRWHHSHEKSSRRRGEGRKGRWKAFRLKPGCRELDAGCWMLEAGGWVLHIWGCWSGVAYCRS